MKYFKPRPDSKAHLAKIQKMMDRHEEVVKCHKCGATNITLRKIPYNNKIFYYCETCIKKAMLEGKDVRIEEKEENQP